MPICINNARECDGCMMCQEDAVPVGYCNATGEAIYPGDGYYRIDGEIYSEIHVVNCLRTADVERL